MGTHAGQLSSGLGADRGPVPPGLGSLPKPDPPPLQEEASSPPALWGRWHHCSVAAVAGTCFGLWSMKGAEQGMAPPGAGSSVSQQQVPRPACPIGKKEMLGSSAAATQPGTQRGCVRANHQVQPWDQSPHSPSPSACSPTGTGLVTPSAVTGDRRKDLCHVTSRVTLRLVLAVIKHGSGCYCRLVHIDKLPAPACRPR